MLCVTQGHWITYRQGRLWAESSSIDSGPVAQCSPVVVYLLQ